MAAEDGNETVRYSPFFCLHPPKHRESPRIRTQGGREAGTFRFYLCYVLAGEGREDWEKNIYYMIRDGDE